MLRKSIVIGAVTAVAGCASVQTEPAPRAVSLERVWTAEGFDIPESVLLSESTGFLYVSNIAGGAADFDGDGYISRVTLDGEIETLRWAEDGLNAPKGMAERDGRLFVTDIDALVEFDLATGAFIARYSADGAQFLNDAAVGPDGRVFASGSRTQSVYEIEGDAMSVWLTGEEFFGANGLFHDGNRMLVANAGAQTLVAVSYDTLNRETLGSELGGADGIGRDAYGGLVVTDSDGRIIRIAPGLADATLLDTRDEERPANDIWVRGDMLYVAEYAPGHVTAYRLVPE